LAAFFSPCRSHVTAQLSGFLGWLSYPLYCVHEPILLIMPSIYNRIDLFSQLGIPAQLVGVISALIIAVAVGMLNDRLHLQRRVMTVLTNTRTARQPSRSSPTLGADAGRWR